jgi:uncharacterized protein with HEPN domain
MHRDYRLYLDDILEAVGRIREYTAGMDREQFSLDRKTQDAVIHNLEVIGEAARNLPDEIKMASSGVAWQKIVGLRNILIHEYFGINIPIIWDIVQNKLGGLEEACRGLLQD